MLSALDLRTPAPINARGDDIEIDSPAPAGRPFLTAEWRDFVMLTYEVDPRALAPLAPRGTELDEWHGSAFVSLVGFLFCKARLFGVRIPLHQQFAEVNLRFYVRRRVDGAWRRGVVFICELVGKRAVAWIARIGYGERFVRVPIRSEMDRTFEAPPRRIAYDWDFAGRSHRLAAWPLGPPRPPAPGSLDEFVVEHYWAYNADRRGESTEYQVVHRPWLIAPTPNAELDAEGVALYGRPLGEFLTGTPASAFWADGSHVRIYAGRALSAQGMRR